MDEKEERAQARGLDVGTAHDRRRPGRRETTNPWLIRMMRGVVEPAIDREPVVARVAAVDDLAATRGIMLGAVVGLVLWLVLAFLAWRFLL